MSSYEFLKDELKKYNIEEFKFNLRTKKTWHDSYYDHDYEFHPQYKILFYKKSFENLLNLDTKAFELKVKFYAELIKLDLALVKMTQEEYTGVYIKNTHLPWYHFNNEYKEWTNSSCELEGIKYFTPSVDNEIYRIISKKDSLLLRKGIFDFALDLGLRNKIDSISNYKKLSQSLNREKMYRTFNNKTYCLRFPSGREYIYGYRQHPVTGFLELEKIVWASDTTIVPI